MPNSLSSPASDENVKNRSGSRVAVLIGQGFEEAEFRHPVDELRQAGYSVSVIGYKPEDFAGIQGFNKMEKGGKVSPDLLIQDAKPEDYTALLLPGGALGVDYLRDSALHIAFVQHFMDAVKPVAIICHGGWLLADAGMAQGKTLTSWPAVRKDLERAGAVWKDQEVIRDGNLVTSRKPDDLPAFTREFLAVIAESLAEKSGEGPGLRRPDTLQDEPLKKLG